MPPFTLIDYEYDLPSTSSAIVKKHPTKRMSTLLNCLLGSPQANSSNNKNNKENSKINHTTSKR